MIDILIYLAIFVIVAIVIWFLISKLAVPEPLATIIMIAFVVIGAVIVIGLLLSLVGHVPLRL